MYLITSAAYVTQDIKNEIGNLPPCFLPIKNTRLYHYQIDTLRLNEKIFLTLPEDYNIDDFDLETLQNRHVEIIRVPADLTLGSSVLFALLEIGVRDEPLRILHGDTLIFDIPDESNEFFIVSDLKDNYDWTVVSEADYGDVVFAGYFSINSSAKFIDILHSNEYDFVRSVKNYYLEHEIKLIKSVEWFDFGHVNTFYRSRASMPNVRHFNSMIIDPRIVHKSGTNRNKIRAEYNWFVSIPMELKYYSPQLVKIVDDGDDVSYELEYLYHLPLSELFVFGSQPHSVWKYIFQCSLFYLNTSRKFQPSAPESYLNNGLLIDKTYERLNEFLVRNVVYSEKVLSYAGVELGTLIDIVNSVNVHIEKPESYDISVIHGDFCFSNILYDARKGDIKVIDPRGLNSKGELDIFGDIRYDYSKFCHSIFGLYDLIVAERYILHIEEHSYFIEFPNYLQIQNIQKVFIETLHYNNISLSKKFLYASMVHLFISMLPLHSESPRRQLALIANSLRLFVELKKL
jgi:hypothetical protein